MALFGCWSCYHSCIMSQFGGDAPTGKSPRGFYGTYRIRRCNKKNKDISAFYRCKDYDFALLSGATFVGYDRNKVKDKPARAYRVDISLSKEVIQEIADILDSLPRSNEIPFREMMWDMSELNQKMKRLRLLLSVNDELFSDWLYDIRHIYIGGSDLNSFPKKRYRNASTEWCKYDIPFNLFIEYGLPIKI